MPNLTPGQLIVSSVHLSLRSSFPSIHLLHCSIYSSLLCFLSLYCSFSFLLTIFLFRSFIPHSHPLPFFSFLQSSLPCFLHSALNSCFVFSFPDLSFLLCLPIHTYILSISPPLPSFLSLTYHDSLLLPLILLTSLHSLFLFPSTHLQR